MGSVAEVSAQAFPEARKTPTPFSHLEVAPLSVSFKLIDLDKSTASESKTFLVKNTGTASLNIDVGAPSESVFTITNGLGHTVIEPKGAPLSVSVLFAPRTADVYKDSISITSDATRGKNSAAVKLDGRAKGAIPTATSTHTPTPSSTPTPSRTATSTSTPTASSTATGTSTPTGTFTATPSPSATATGTSTATPTAVPTPTINLTATGTPVTVTPTPTSTPTPASFFNGSVAVNGAPVSGATINFYAVGNTGYRSAADSLGTTSTAGDGTYTVGYTCPSDGIETYAVAVGGDAGNGANSAIGLMAPVGPCGSIVQSSTKVVIDELTTAAAQVALAQFVDSTGEMVGVSATNAGGLTLGYTNYYNLAGVDSAGDFSVNGLASSFLPSVGNCPSDSTPNCDGLERLNTLSNIIAACARSSGPASQPCSDLFTGTSSSGTTLAAIHAVAINPTLNVAAVFAIQSAISTPPYQPALSSAPDGFEIGLRLAPADAGLGANTALAIDSMGDLFVISLQDLAQTQAVSEIISASGYSDGASFAPGITLADGASIAIDTNNNLFVTSRDSDAVSELLALNDYSAFSVFSPGEAAALDNPQSIALDAAGNLFVANNPAGDTTGSVSELIALGNYSTGFNYTSQDANLTCPVSLVLDFAGDIFVANCDGTVSELTVASSYHSGASFNVDLAADNGVAAVESAIGLDTDANVLVLTSGIASGGVSENTAASFYHSNQFFSPEDAAFNAPSAMTLDSGGNLFAINVDDAGWHLSELTAASAYAEGLAFSPQGANFCAPDALAVDAAGNVFVANQCQTGVGATPVVSELLGLAAPVLTPTQACLQLGQNACLP